MRETASRSTHPTQRDDRFLWTLVTMPTVLRSGPYRFFFYSGDRDEPPHVHVERDDREAKFWLDPIRLERSGGFASKELNKIQKLIEDNLDRLLESWDDYFGS